MKNGIFYMRFLLVLFGLIGFTFAKADPIVIEAEDASTIYKGVIDPRNGGAWTGIGGEAIHGAYFEYNVSIPEAGTYDVKFDLATCNDRRIYVKVNSQLPVVVDFLNDNYSTSWDLNNGTKTIQVYFDAGNNTLVLGAYQHNGEWSAWHMPVIDKFTITKSAINVSKLAGEYSIVIPAQNATENSGFGNKDISNVGESGMDFHGVSGKDGYLSYDVVIPDGKEGLYTLLVGYASGSERYINLLVNGGTENQFAQEILTPSSGRWGDENKLGNNGLISYNVSTKFNLQVGTNNIKLIQNTNTSKDGGWYPDVSQLTLVKYGKYEEVTGPPQPGSFPIVIEAENADVLYKMFNPETRSKGDVSWVGIGGDAKALYGSYLQLNVTVETAGVYDLKMDYATCDDRIVSLKVNNQVSDLVYITNADYSSDWNLNDGTKTVQVYLDEGTNTITIGAYHLNMNNNKEKWFMPIFDKFIINPSETTIAKLPEEYIVNKGAQETVERTGNWSNVDKDDTGFHGVGGETGYVKYEMNIPTGKAGKYTIVIDYLTADNRYFTVLANEGTAKEYTYELLAPSNGTWGDAIGDNGLLTYKLMSLVDLTEGTNTVKLIASNGWTPNIGSLLFVKYGAFEATGPTAAESTNPAGVSVYTLSNKIVISSSDIATYNIYDLMGKVVTSGTVSLTEKEISVVSGVYIVKVNNFVKKVVVR